MQNRVLGLNQRQRYMITRKGILAKGGYRLHSSKAYEVSSEISISVTPSDLLYSHRA